MSVGRGERRIVLFRVSWLTYSVASWEVASVPWEPLDEDGEEVPIYDGCGVCDYILYRNKLANNPRRAGF